MAQRHGREETAMTTPHPEAPAEGTDPQDPDQPDLDEDES